MKGWAERRPSIDVERGRPMPCGAVAGTVGERYRRPSGGAGDMPIRDDERAGTMASGASLPLNSSTSFSPKTTPRFGCWCFNADRSVATACLCKNQRESDLAMGKRGLAVSSSSSAPSSSSR